MRRPTRGETRCHGLAAGPGAIYLDHHATTPVDPAVLQAMLPYFTERFGNPSSRQHAFGEEADAAVEEARAQVAALIGAAPADIVFTSGATESNNLAIRGRARARPAARPPRGHDRDRARGGAGARAARLEREGFAVTRRAGRRRRDRGRGRGSVRAAARHVLVSVMAANNEVGTLQPVAEIGRLCRERGIVFHSDAVQAAGRVPVRRRRLGRRPDEPVRPQDVRPQGRGRALRAQGAPAAPAAAAADGRRRAGEGPPLGHAERAGDRRAAAPPRGWPAQRWPAASRSGCAALRDRLLAGLRVADRGRRGQRRARAAAARQPPRLDRARGSGDADPFPRRPHRDLVGRGLRGGGREGIPRPARPRDCPTSGSTPRCASGSAASTTPPRSTPWWRRWPTAVARRAAARRRGALSVLAVSRSSGGRAKTPITQIACLRRAAVTECKMFQVAQHHERFAGA